jgi:hypothetical protein
VYEAAHFSRLRGPLRARLGNCWEQLDDVVSELFTVHEVAGARILRAGS